MGIFDKKPYLYHLSTPLVLGGILGIVDFVQSRQDFTDILSYLIRSTSAACVIWAIMYPCTAMVNGADTNKKIPLLLRLFFASIVGAIPLATLLPLLTSKLAGTNSVDDVSWMPVAVYEDLLMQRYIRILLLVAPVWCALTYWWYKQREENIVTENIPKKNTPAETEKSQTPEPKHPAFLDKMTKPIGRSPWCIKAEQHYIRIYTESGDEMVLYRFSDAIKNLEGFDGLQVHRSYWVAREAVANIETTDKSYILHLKNGLETPVSRSYKKAVEAAKLL